jgi:transcriptional regulator with XRE-family HTH domain
MRAGDTPLRDLPAGGRALPHDFSIELGQRITHLRRDRGLATPAAADLLGITQAALSKIESGRAAPSLATLLRLQVVLGLDSIEALLGDLPSPIAGRRIWGQDR